MATPPSRRTLRLPPTQASGKAASKDDIYERIYEAVVEHRLLPGTKLSEERVAELFAVSRTQVRGVLQRLAVEQLVTLIPNRGAFVTTPSAEEAHDVLEVRRTLEPAVVRRLIERIAAGKANTALKQLRTLVKREQQAHASGDRRAAVRLSGEFHVLLAQLSGSAIMARMLRELTPLTCLAILTFDAPTGAACPNDEHTELLDAIEAGDADAAVALMDEHLHHIEKSLNLDAEAAPEIDLAEALLG
ncbi:GntR family transcriptional regulator [Pseudorhodoferax sp. LjRoot39]|jgi:DNA-binding GntR family transcriptional regulator|uniref:GntR family transcriptional regulator n=1 Tax=Pseudorhodoferax sp. LjRoot39 TaxID=3342328 RepID=UPI003ECF7585